MTPDGKVTADVGHVALVATAGNLQNPTPSCTCWDWVSESVLFLSVSIQSQVVFRWWKISLRSEYRSAKPGEAKDSHEEFLENSHLQGKEGSTLCTSCLISFNQ